MQSIFNCMNPLSRLRLEVACAVVRNPHLTEEDRHQAFEKIKNADRPTLHDLIREHCQDQ